MMDVKTPVPNRWLARGASLLNRRGWRPRVARLRARLRDIVCSSVQPGGSASGTQGAIILRVAGHCPACDQNVEFVARDAWLRDHLFCSNCGSIPRERALMAVIETFAPHWRELVVHESSPGYRGASLRLQKECPAYIPSQYFADIAAGETVEGMRCENLEALSFADNSVDLHVTQDVLEHLFFPSRAFREIARTLKPGGMHICTVPIVNKERPSEIRARMDNGVLVHLLPAQYHGNPIGDGQSLVTVDWGYDICRHIFEACGLFTQMLRIDDLSQGIRAEYIEVLVTVKPSQPGAACPAIP